MKRRVILFVSIYFFFVLFFIIGKIVFMAIYGHMAVSLSIGDFFAVLYNGLPLDCSMAGYLSLIPGFVILSSIWVNKKWINQILKIYTIVILTMMTIVTICDLLIYPHWGYHFDATVFLYIQKPKEAIASGSVFELMLGAIALALLVIVFYFVYKFVIGRQVDKLAKVDKSIPTAIVVFLLIGALFLPIRGGVSVSTMNVGKAYFSDDMFLNHAAINPHFNLFYSLFKSKDFSKEYQFFEQTKALVIADSLNYKAQCDSIPQLLNTDKPNIFIFILESFSAELMKDSAVMPNLNRFAKEGISFTNFYGNSFRTERGVVSILSAYPAHPTVAIMKYPQKTQKLPSIPASLKENGYNLSFYYGGDADYANMQSYYVGTCRVTDITSDKDFPISQRLTKWGAADNYVFDRVAEDLENKPQTEPFCKTILTLSSHEPFDVPTSRFESPYFNSVFFTDSCLGVFVDKLKAQKQYKNSLIVLLSDHSMQSYPQNMPNYSPLRFHIPMVWLGGAVKEPRKIEEYGSQLDLAATLLSQLKINHNDFYFSKDMMNPNANKFAYYAYVNGFTMIDSTGYVIFDNEKNGVIEQKGNPYMETQAKAFFQKMYLDLGSR